MPYQPKNMDCKAERCSDWESRLIKLNNYTDHASTEALKNAIATVGPVVASMAVYSDFFGYGSGIYEKTASVTLSGYHCVCVAGYDDTDGYWIIKNSWGPCWGKSGFCKIVHGQADLLINTSWPFYSVTRVSCRRRETAKPSISSSTSASEEVVGSGPTLGASGGTGTSPTRNSRA